ncbi:histidinol-phosphate transaminase [Croceivirga thetidis]|uniref:Histidinol-phosphate aminotransferase n=1 Tax=Croceivirga thetidis TaxID=2721623 RepID=A0ABX1GRH4_9FLAO|nr:histidinol-phosphate transaminase [Croceivirga thetidis]NKI32238.1 histidinol-phosphate transaminase [Croceivirga thetidis]
MARQFNIENLVRNNVKALKPYSSARDEFKDFDSDMVFLDANENPFENGVNRYPDPQQRNLKAVLAEQKGIMQNQILLGNGSDEVLDLIFRAFCEPHVDNIITLPPTYGMYKVLSETNAVENREVYLNSDFQPAIDGILKNVDSQTKLLFLCSPNNPTGNAFKVDYIEHILKEFQGIVVIDEAYIDFSKSESWVARLEEFPNLIVTQTLSKAYGMAGIRLGICYASRAIIETLNKIKPPYNVNQLTQEKALERVLKVDSVGQEVERILSERNKLVKALNKVEFIKKIFPSDANFILVRVDDANLRYEQLIANGIVIRNRSTQPLCENTLRFTVGTSIENEKLVNALIKLSNG